MRDTAEQPIIPGEPVHDDDAFIVQVASMVRPDIASDVAASLRRHIGTIQRMPDLPPNLISRH